MICPRCGSTISDTARFCPTCNVSYAHPATPAHPLGAHPTTPGHPPAVPGRPSDAQAARSAMDGAAAVTASNAAPSPSAPIGHYGNQQTSDVQEGRPQTEPAETKIPSKIPSYIGFALCVLVVAVALVRFFSISPEPVSAPIEAASTEASDFKLGGVYDLQSTMLVSGWQSGEENRRTAQTTINDYEMYMLFEAQEELCFAMVKVNRDEDRAVFDAIEANIDTSQELFETMELPAVGVAGKLDEKCVEEYETTLENLHDQGIPCNPVRLEFGYLDADPDSYVANLTERHAEAAARSQSMTIIIGFTAALVIFLVSMRRVFAIRRKEQDMA